MLSAKSGWCLLLIVACTLPAAAPNEPPTKDCRLVRCAAPHCPRPLPPPPGECCPFCKFDCRVLFCPPVDCPRPLPPPRGECCQVCPDGCNYNGKFYEVGSSFPAKDGCNKCRCIRKNRVACTKRACPKGCEVNGIYYKPGETFTAPDGCNTCTCFGNGIFGCTRIFCQCPVKGQVFTECGSACPANCTTPNPPCTLQCVPRCECPRGTVIDEVSNSCVPPKDCPCPVKGQVFTECGSACPASCTTPNPICIALCVPRCECPRGTVIDEVSNSCVPPKECPCPVKGQVFKECASACPGKCNTPTPRCTLQCVPQCECPRGTVIDEVSNSCVPPNKCPCPVKGQVFKECASACPANCTIPTPVCSRECVRRCECPRGKVIDEVSNTCVFRNQCPPLPCPPDKPPVNCFVNPCQFARCPAHPRAKCVADFCGGCFARFFDAKGNEVTDSCGRRG